MGKNDYLAKQQAMRQAVFSAGEDIGMQRMWDAVSAALHDPEIMGKDTLGKMRMQKLYQGVRKKMDAFHKAFTPDVEADYVQEKMDAELREIWGEDLVPFPERYPDIKQFGYDKARKGWK